MTIRGDDLQQFKGHFVGVEGDSVTVMGDPPADAPYPIRCGFWETVSRHVGARQAHCSFCKQFVGVSPDGWKRHEAYREGRPLVCPLCFDLFLKCIETSEGR